MRGTGAGRKLIEAVAAAAGDSRLYWLTYEDNATARQLYDRLARFSGAIRYDYTKR
jgi:GNAT superfamily N-acetyltransferase